MFATVLYKSCRQPRDASLYSLYKYFVAPVTELVSRTHQRLHTTQPPPREVVSPPQGELTSLAGVCLTTKKRGCLSTSLRLTTNIAAATLLWAATHRLAVNSQLWQPRLRFHQDYDSTRIKIQPWLRFNSTKIWILTTQPSLRFNQVHNTLMYCFIT